VNARERLLEVGLLLAGGLLAASTIRTGVGHHDEGLMLAWAERIADGQWPYRDFWSNYPPGQALIDAGLVKVFGPSLLAWRVVRVLVGAVAAVLGFRLVRGRGAGLPTALLAWAAVAGALAWPLTPGPGATAVLLAFTALLLAPRSLAAGAAVAGLAAVFRVEVGAAAALGVVLLAPEARAGWRAAGIAAATALIALLPFLIAAPGEMLDQTAGFLGIAGMQRTALRLDPAGVGVDPNKLLELWFPALLLAGSAVLLAWILVRRPQRRDVVAAPLVVVGVLYLLSRADEFHLVPLAPALAVAAAVAAATVGARGWRAVLVLVVGVIAVHGWERQAGLLLHPPAQAAVPGGVGDGVRMDAREARALAGLIPRVRALTPHGEPVLVAPPRYDRVRVGDPLLNVLLRRHNPSRYDVVQPGVVTTASVQREIARDLRRTPVVVRWLGADARRVEDNGSGRSSGVHLLDRAIDRDYRAAGRYGDWLLLVRR
jgi:hypothetical protein